MFIEFEVMQGMLKEDNERKSREEEAKRKKPARKVVIL
jgi:hypothetical protein